MKKSVDPHLQPGEELLSDIPIAEVDSIEVGKGTLTEPVSAFDQGKSGS